MIVLGARIDRVIDGPALMLSATVLAPTVTAAALSGRAVWWRAAIVALSALIACERSALAPLGVALHGIAICLGIVGLSASLTVPPLFAVSTAMLAGGSVLLTACGARLRSLGSFTFIPVLYVACETAEGADPDAVAALGLRAVPYVLIALVPVFLVSALRHHAARAVETRYADHFRRLTRWRKHGDPQRAGQDACAAVLGVASAALLVEWQHLPHGQWMIWSVVSVIAGEATVVHRKMYDRALGALSGVPIGIGVGALLPPFSATIGVATTVGLLTLVAFRSYRLAFGLRCACVALALMTSQHSTLAAAERASNVLLGGIIGVLAFNLVRVTATTLAAAVRREG